MIAGRYIVRVGRQSDEPPAYGSLPLVHDRDNVRIRADCDAIAIGDAGFVFGHLFTRTLPARRVQSLPAADAETIAGSHGRALIERYWGGYVAVLFLREETVVLRDPSGAMPCFHVQDWQALALSNDAASACIGNSEAGGVDIGGVGRCLAGMEWLGRDTCLTGVEELWPGERLTVSDNGVVSDSLWSPFDHTHPSTSAESSALAAELGETVLDTVGAWGNVFPSILLGVSGGLDSSIVARSLVGAGTDLRLLTMVGPDPQGDETRFASVLADALGILLLARRFEPGCVDVAQPNLAHLPWPLASYFTQAIAAVHREIESDCGIAAFFTGSGGDNIFCSMGSARPVADRLLAEGPGIAALSTAHDVARLSDTTLFEVGRSAWRHMRARRSPVRPTANLAGLSREWCDALASPPSAPWPQPPEFALPGKAMHIRLLARAMKGHELYARSAAPPQIAPLLAQPVVELCLGIPTWHWVEGGRDRAVARDAFSALLPPSLIERRSKGGPTGFMIDLYRRNAAAIHDLLHQGMLVQAGLIDPLYCTRVDDHDPGARPKMLRLLTFASTECWVRHWSAGGWRTDC